MELTFKLPVLILLGLIIVALIEAMYYLAKDKGDIDSTRVVRALTVRIALALALFAILMIGAFTGWIKPHGI
jgi:Mn2+/Fe2+ NRAMP family transporter